MDGVEVFQSPGKGRGLRATREFGTGEVVFACRPYAAVAFDSMVESVCHCCLRRGGGGVGGGRGGGGVGGGGGGGGGGSLHRCASCRFALYCDRSCQRRAWAEGHGPECRALKQSADAGGRPGENVRLAARILWRWHKEGRVRAAEDLTSIAELQDHLEALGAEERSELEMNVGALGRYWTAAASGGDGDVQLFAHVLALIGCNCFTLSDDGGMAPAGVGLFTNLCLLNHDCWPNCTAVFNAGRMEIRALQKVPAGCELTVAYVDFMSPSVVRRQQLVEQYHFVCECQHCQGGIKDELMMGLRKSGDDAPSAEEVGQVEQLTKETHEKVEELKKRNLWVDVLKLCRQCLSAQEAVFGECHVSLVRMVRLTADVLAYLQSFNEAATFAQRTVDAMEKIYHPNNAQLGMMVMRAGVTHWHAGLIEKAHAHICRALGILMVTHGPQHPITRDLEGLRVQTEMELRLFRENEFAYKALREAALQGSSMRLMAEPHTGDLWHK